jgi:hypothetical protein
MGEVKSCYVTIHVLDLTTKGNGWLSAQMQSALLYEYGDVLKTIGHFTYQEVGFSEEEQTVMFRVSVEMPERKSIQMTLQERLQDMSKSELTELFHDAETLHNTGVLADTAPLRRLTEETFGNSMVLQMTTVGYNVYRTLAVLYMT